MKKIISSLFLLNNLTIIRPRSRTQNCMYWTIGTKQRICVFVGVKWRWVFPDQSIKEIYKRNRGRERIENQGPFWVELKEIFFFLFLFQLFWWWNDDYCRLLSLFNLFHCWRRSGEMKEKKKREKRGTSEQQQWWMNKKRRKGGKIKIIRWGPQTVEMDGNRCGWCYSYFWVFRRVFF